MKKKIPSASSLVTDMAGNFIAAGMKNRASRDGIKKFVRDMQPWARKILKEELDNCQRRRR